MAVITGAFEHHGVKITVQKPNGFSRQRHWRFQRMLVNEGTDGIPLADASGIAFYLANTVACAGDLGFSVVPLDPTHSQLMDFIRGVGESDADLIKGFDDAISELMSASVTNDPDLVPPEKLGEKKG